MANHGFLGGCLHAHKRWPALGETGPFGPPPNGYGVEVFMTGETTKDGGVPQLLSLRRGQWPNPRGFGDLRIGESTSEHPEQ
ncbi:hypothetical protein CXB51_011186 [Gossypium anomalum]|uniref:Uncharacterized protein n=1 Tax=Gossypium anomalum TaxID=47600 RepID=A0A8J5YNV6_9ROSI|nr:hypothetical protein CXB51_011186 [Gossypium anomalum]